MNYEQATGRSIEEAFQEYHKNNPEVFSLFCEQVRKAVGMGKKKISSKAVINWIRWEKYLITNDVDLFNIEGKERSFMINDAFHSRYSRLYVQLYPQHEKLFEFRRLRTQGIKEAA
jgi:hypothetical protein